MNSDPESGGAESRCVPGHRMTSGIQPGGDRQSPNCSDEQKPILTYMTIGNNTQIATHKCNSPLPRNPFKYTLIHFNLYPPMNPHAGKIVFFFL